MQARKNIGKTYFTYEFNVTVTRGHIWMELQTVTGGHNGM